MDWQSRARELLNDWESYRCARPREHVWDIQAEKDQISIWASRLHDHMLWSDNLNELAEACYQFESKLNTFKDKIVLELLTNGAA